MEDRLANIETNQTKAFLESNIEEVKEPEQIFSCTKCNFETSSEKGLQIHNARKHTKYEKENYPRSCDVCSEMFTKPRDMKKHMKIHSYKSTSYDCRCEECDYVCKTAFTMEMHVGKNHKEEFECGMCECKFENIEVLEIHQATCEVYQCGDSDCKERVKTISEIKKHLAEVHGHPMQVVHLKIDREDPQEINSKWHWSNHL